MSIVDSSCGNAVERLRRLSANDAKKLSIFRELDENGICILTIPGGASEHATEFKMNRTNFDFLTLTRR
jgi:hypothetical protein